MGKFCGQRGWKKIINSCQRDSIDSLMVDNKNIIEYQSMYDSSFTTKFRKELKNKKMIYDLEEAERLLKIGDYTPAVILALRYLEDLMRKNRIRMDNNEDERRMTLGVMLKKYARLFGENEVFKVIHFRNEIVHTNKVVSEEDAIWIINFVKRCIDKLENN